VRVSVPGAVCAVTFQLVRGNVILQGRHKITLDQAGKRKGGHFLAPVPVCRRSEKRVIWLVTWAGFQVSVDRGHDGRLDQDKFIITCSAFTFHVKDLVASFQLQTLNLGRGHFRAAQTRSKHK